MNLVIWTPIILAVCAAVTGVVIRNVTGLVAEALGKSRIDAERAIASAGISLIGHRRTPASGGPQADGSEPRSADRG